MSRSDVKVPLLYVEGLRVDAYFSIRDVKRLKLLKDDYDYFAAHGPKEFRLLWKSTSVFCEMKIAELTPNYFGKGA